MENYRIYWIGESGSKHWIANITSKKITLSGSWECAKIYVSKTAALKAIQHIQSISNFRNLFLDTTTIGLS